MPGGRGLNWCLLAPLSQLSGWAAFSLDLGVVGMEGEEESIEGP